MSSSRLQEIKAQIAEGHTGRAIELLVEYTRETNSSKHDDALLLSGHYRQWKRQMTMGVEQSSSELRRIELAMMELLQEEPAGPVRVEATPPAATPPPAKNRLPLIVGGGLVLLAIIYFATTVSGATQEPGLPEEPISGPAVTPTTPEEDGEQIELSGLTSDDVRLITLTNLRDQNTPKFIRRVPRPAWAGGGAYKDDYVFWDCQRAGLESFATLIQTGEDARAMYFTYGGLTGEAKIDLETGEFTSSQVINNTPFTGSGRVASYTTKITAGNAAIVTYNDPENGNPYRIRLSYGTEWFRDSGNGTQVLGKYEEIDRSAGLITLREERSGRIYTLDLNAMKLRYQDGDEPEVVYSELTGVY